MKKNKSKQVRISAELHRRLKLAAFKNAFTVNYLAEVAVKKMLENLGKNGYEL